MPAQSKSQRQAAAIAEYHPEQATGAAKDMAASMSKGQLHDFAATKEKGLPEKKAGAATPPPKRRSFLEAMSPPNGWVAPNSAIGQWMPKAKTTPVKLPVKVESKPVAEKKAGISPLAAQLQEWRPPTAPMLGGLMGGLAAQSMPLLSQMSYPAYSNLLSHAAGQIPAEMPGGGNLRAGMQAAAADPALHTAVTNFMANAQQPQAQGQLMNRVLENPGVFTNIAPVVKAMQPQPIPTSRGMSPTMPVGIPRPVQGVPGMEKTESLAEPSQPEQLAFVNSFFDKCAELHLEPERVTRMVYGICSQDSPARDAFETFVKQAMDLLPGTAQKGNQPACGGPAPTGTEAADKEKAREKELMTKRYGLKKASWSMSNFLATPIA